MVFIFFWGGCLLAFLILSSFICKPKLIIPITQDYCEEQKTLCIHVQYKWKRIFLAVRLVWGQETVISQKQLPWDAVREDELSPRIPPFSALCF